MKDKGWRGFIGTLKCLVGVHDWSDRQWSVPRCARPNCYKFKKRKQPKNMLSVSGEQKETND